MGEGGYGTGTYGFGTGLDEEEGLVEEVLWGGGDVHCGWFFEREELTIGVVGDYVARYNCWILWGIYFGCLFCSTWHVFYIVTLMI